jgi:hypothetical protein
MWPLTDEAIVATSLELFDLLGAVGARKLCVCVSHKYNSNNNK